MKKVLLTGANGLLGANLVRELNKQGYSVRALLRKGSNRLSLEGVAHDVFEGNMTCAEDMENAVDGCDYVIHSAANTAQNSEPWEEFKKVNIQVTETLSELCLEKGIKRFIFVSTANCFSNGTMEHPGTEETAFMPWLRRSGYAYSKYLAQNLVLRKVREKGLNAIVVAPTFMIGAYDAKLSSGQLIMHGLRNNFIMHPSGGKSFVDVKAAATATVNGLKMGDSGQCYMLSGVNMTYGGFFKVLKEVAGQKSLRLQLPRWFVLLAGAMVGTIKKILPLKTPFNTTNARLLTLGNYFSNEKAKQTLKMPETDLRSALKDAIEWFMQNKYLS